MRLFDAVPVGSSLFLWPLNLTERTHCSADVLSAIRFQIKIFGLLNADLVLRFDEELLSFGSNDFKQIKLGKAHIHVHWPIVTNIAEITSRTRFVF